MKDGTDSGAVKRFLKLVRRRLWVVEWLDGARSALWLSSIALILLAAAHTWLTGVPTQLLLFTLTAVAVVVLARVLNRRPTLLHAARLADQRFGGRAVMTTAVECLPRALLADTEASTVVLRQASRAAREWQANIKTAFELPQRTASSVALVPLFVALMLLTRPGAETEILPLAEEHPGLELLTGAISQPDTATTEVKLVDVAPANAAPTEAASSTASPVEGAVTEADDAAEISVDMDRDGLSAGTASADGEAGDMAGDALPNTSSREGDDEAAASLVRGEAIAIERTGASLASADANDLPYSDTQSPAVSFVANVLPAAPPDSTTGGTTLTRAQAAYADRYLKGTSDSND
jgi:hypothetical protein